MRPSNPSESALLSRLVRCEQCGYDNDSRYRFCGMCGAKLPAPEPIATRPEPQREAPRAVSGPSFLGLAEENASNVSYLLEDEVSSGHRSRIVVLLLLIGLGVGAWHWRRDWRTLVDKVSNQLGTETASKGAPPPTSASPSEVAPAMGNPDQSAVVKPRTGVGDEPPAVSANSDKGTPANSGNGESSGDKSSNADNNSQSAAKSAAPAEPAAQAKGESSADQKVAAEKPALRPAAGKHEDENATGNSDNAGSAGDALETEGERYLYGTGVPANCDRAQKSLIAAANQSNSKAATVLGTMYATGHCASRDLPLAYRWFAKALQQEPGNARYQRDLEVLWNHMSPDERKLAMQRRQ